MSTFGSPPGGEGQTSPLVMAGLVPAIHVLLSARKDVDARHKAGHDGGGWGAHQLPLTILRQTLVAEHIDGALLDGQVGGACGGLEAERHHQRPRSAAMRDRYRVRQKRVVP